MQKRNRVILGVVVVVAVTVLAIATVNHYTNKKSVQQETDVVAPDSAIESPSEQPNSFFKIDTARRQKRINRRMERMRVQDSIKAAEQNKVN